MKAPTTQWLSATVLITTTPRSPLKKRTKTKVGEHTNTHTNQSLQRIFSEYTHYLGRGKRLHGDVTNSVTALTVQTSVNLVVGQTSLSDHSQLVQRQSWSYSQGSADGHELPCCALSLPESTISPPTKFAEKSRPFSCIISHDNRARFLCKFRHTSLLTVQIKKSIGAENVICSLCMAHN